MTYYRLLDPKHKDIIIRAEGKTQEEYVPKKGWIKNGIMLHYFWPESDTYDRYEEITEKEALQIINNN